MPRIYRLRNAALPARAGRYAVMPGRAMLSEVFALTPGDGAASGFVLAQLPRGPAPLLWVQDRVSRQEAGRPYLPGLGLPGPILRVDVARAADVLSAAEDGLHCTALSAVVAEIWGDPPALSFTASKRLALRAEASGLPCWLIRRGASPDLSAARERWRVVSLPSAPHPDDPAAPGAPRWRAELFRARDRRPGTWVMCYDPATDRVDLSAPFADGALAKAGHAGG